MSDRILVCVPVRKGYTPLKSSYQSLCTECKRAVWIARSSPITDRVLCIECGLKIMNASKSVEVAPPTNEQIKEIKDNQ